MGMHHSSVPGKRVHIILNDGTRLVGRYVSRTDRRLELTISGKKKRIPWSAIRAFSNYRKALG